MLSSFAIFSFSNMRLGVHLSYVTVETASVKKIIKTADWLLIDYWLLHN